LINEPLHSSQHISSVSGLSLQQQITHMQQQAAQQQAQQQQQQQAQQQQAQQQQQQAQQQLLHLPMGQAVKARFIPTK